MNKGIIVLEGADSAGKTTLAKELLKRHYGTYIHLGYRKNIFAWQTAALRKAIREAQHGIVVIDRHWPSEMAYGTTYRAGPSIPVAARCLDRVLLKHASLMVMCVPSDREAHLKRHQKMLEERDEYAKDISKVVTYYFDLFHGAQKYWKGTSYGDQLIQGHGLEIRPDVKLYDLDQDGDRLTSYCKEVTDLLAWLRSIQPPQARQPDRPNLLGHLGLAKVCFLAEDLSPAGKAGRVKWPMYWDESVSAASFFNRHLHALRIDESLLCYSNALDPDDHLRTIMNTGMRVVCVGKHALKRVEAAKYFNYRHVDHPQFVRRFDHARPYHKDLSKAISDINGIRL